MNADLRYRIRRPEFGGRKEKTDAQAQARFSLMEIRVADLGRTNYAIYAKYLRQNTDLLNITFIHSDIKTGSIKEQFDVIVSNPPYVSLREYSTLQPEITKYEPQSAVTDHNEGYDFYKIIIQRTAEILKEKGHLYFEAGKGQAETIMTMMAENSFTDLQAVKDYQNIDRVIYGAKT